MLSEDSVEPRHGAPGVNSRCVTATHSEADLEVLKEIENVYFSDPSEFDAAQYVLESAPSPPTPEAIDQMCAKLKRQHQVVSSKALHLISQQRDNCDREFAEIQHIREDLTNTLATCRNTREQLNFAKQHLTISSFVILANFRKRKIIKSVLKTLELLRSLRSVESDVANLMSANEYEEAIALIQNSLKAAGEHKEYNCIGDLAARLRDNLDMTEEKLDIALAGICYNFDEDIFLKLRKAYNLLGKIQAAMEQLHMHYSSAINESALEAVRLYVDDGSELKLNDICLAVPTNRAPACLLNLCEKLFAVMRSYYLLVEWHSKNDIEVTKANNVLDIEKNVSREYIKQKLKAGLLRIWHDVQAKVSTFLKSSGLEEYPFEKFIQTLGILRKLTQVAEVFCGDKSDTLQEFMKNHSVTYIKNYHKGRMEELRLFLENEGWEQCPVKSNFNVLHLQEFKQFKKYINPNRADVSVSKTLSDGASSVNSQDESVYIAKYFKSKTNKTPFDIFHNENITNDDIFGVEATSDFSESDDEPDELKRDFIDDADVNDYSKPEKQESPSKVKQSVIVTSTTLSVLRNCGQYLQICRYLPQISLEVIVLMNQLFDYYFYTVHLFFTSDLEVGTATLYTPKLNAILKRISNNIDESNNTSNNEAKTFVCPEIPNHLDMTSEDKLHGLTERIVGVESVIFLSKQFILLQPYLESIVALPQKVILEHFKESTLEIVADLRMPVYMSSVSRAVDAKTALSAMSQVKWDVKSVAVEHSSYVEMILRKIQYFALRLENISANVSLNSEVITSIWTTMSKFVVHLLVEGYSNALKCTNGGRGLMQLDYRQLFLKLEKISGLKPIPYQEYVDTYVKAYYLPRAALEDFVKERNEYSNKHLIALVTCACDNKRDRQELLTHIESKE